MFKQYLIITIRNLIRQKVISFINIFGLSVGIASFSLLSIFIINEFEYDNFHENYDNIYRVVSDVTMPDGRNMVVPRGLSTMSTKAVEQLPEIEKSTLFFDVGDVKIKINEQYYYDNNMFYVDSNFFDIFSFIPVAGNLKNAITTPNYIVITESMAKKLFQKDNPINKNVFFYDETYIVGAVIKDIPSTSHINFDFVTNFESINNLNNFFARHGFDFFIYYLSSPDVDYDVLNSKFQHLSKKVSDERFAAEGMSGSFGIDCSLQPLSKVHLHSKFLFDIGDPGSMRDVLVFSLLALLILIIAIVNFINLVISFGNNRAKEVAVRKASGAYRKHLVYQFLGEALIMVFFAIIIGLMFTEIFVGMFGDLLDRELAVPYGFLYFIAILIFGLVVGVISGAYPAFYLSKFNPIQVLKGITTSGKKRTLQIVTVLLQFGSAVFLISIVIIINSQIQFMKKQNLGFEKENVVIVHDISDKIREKYKVLKHDLLSQPNIIEITGSQSVPGYHRSVQNCFLKDQSPNEAIIMTQNGVQANYVKTFQMEIVLGRDYDENLHSDSSTFIINETAVKQLGLENPIGQIINVWKNQGEIIGVVKDFHYTSFHKKIEPLALSFNSNYFDIISIRLKAGNEKVALQHIKEILKSYDASYNFKYNFIDERFDQLYRAEEKANKLIMIGSILAIIISILGLFALTNFTVKERTKEIGIRKALGASIRAMVLLMVKDITKWVLFVNIISWPLAYFFVSNWLQNFEYRISLNIWMFLLAGILAFVIALVTIIFVVVKTANANPVEALKYE